MVSYRQLQLVCVCYIIAWMIAPPLAYDTIFRIIAIIAAGVWILLQQRVRYKDEYDPEVQRHIQWYKLLSIIYIIFLYFFRIIFDELSFFAAFYQDITTYILIFTGYLAAIYVRGKRYEDLKKIFILILIIAVVFSLTTMLRGSEYETLTRNAGGEADAAYLALAREAAMHGVGAFGFFCFTSVFSPILLWYIFSSGAKHKVWLTLCFIIIEAGVFSAGYTLALLISIIGIGVVVALRVKNPVIKILSVLLLLLFVLFWQDFSTFLYHTLQNLTNGTMYANKVNDIFSFLLEGESTGTFAARQERYLISWESIWKYPVFGSYIMASTRAVGYHSSVLDTFAAYGWIVGMAWIYITNIFPIKIAKSLHKGYKIVAFLLLFFTALFNTYTMMMGVFYFAIPCVSIMSRECKHFVKRV